MKILLPLALIAGGAWLVQQMYVRQAAADVRAKAQDALSKIWG